MYPKSKDPKLIIRVTNFELIQPMCPRYRNVTDGRTDRQTDGRTTYDSNTALALRASRGKNGNDDPVGVKSAKRGPCIGLLRIRPGLTNSPRRPVSGYLMYLLFLFAHETS